ncbi:MAG: ABC transporter permease, partial [Bacteroidetes bacterium]
MYFNIAWRNLLRNRAFSAINIAGLSIGMASCLLIVLYVQHELSYDRFHKKAERMVRVHFYGKVQGQKMQEVTVMPPLAQAFMQDYPEVEEAVRLRPVGRPAVVYEGKKFRDARVAWADAHFFTVFSLPLAEGEIRTALREPNSLVISRSMAETYFG